MTTPDVPVVAAVLGKVAQLAPSVEGVDEVELTAAERERAHLRVRSRGKRELVVSLPRGEELQDGDVIRVDNGVAVGGGGPPPAAPGGGPAAAPDKGPAGPPP